MNPLKNFTLITIGVYIAKRYYSFTIGGDLGQIKKISVFQVTGPKVSGTVGTHSFFNYYSLSKCIKLYFFPENLKIFLGFTSKFRQGRVTLNTGFFLFDLMSTDILCKQFWTHHHWVLINIQV